ncbi:mediator of RNA polymerase II transcription subunit 12 isoform X2 [Neltuma alba]|uniref:mediator of RNA polymerase II transcription subunit 12 isoform X2 n=1 Tax=Neltuma alba TaxID=207710 RepID=UPI0010A3D86B|nr:mediator of RNA polymerase II transcription subunit 12-like isoform X2 [Prosopis alba]
MQRYHTGSSTGAVSSSALSRQSVRDTGRADSSSLLSNYSVSSRQPQLNPYKLKCDKEPLNTRLGSPDFFPQAPNCPEETLTRGYVQSGYRETVEGLEEAREVSLNQVSNFNKAVIINCKEAVKKRLRAINESRVQKRKAGQVYGVALSGTQLNRPGIFPEQRPAGEDFREKWIEGLSQQHKRLRSLSDHVPHGFRKKLLLEVLIKNNVPLLRATWFIKVTYLNQVRSGSASISSGIAARSENWTKDVVDYLQSLLDEFISKDASDPAHSSRDCSPQMHHAGSLQHRSDRGSSVSDNGEPSVYFKWWYAVRLLQWHHAEGLLLPSLVIDWVLNQLQEKASTEILQLLLPIIYGFLETVVLSQTYVRNLAGMALRIICDPAPGGSDLVDNSRRAYTTCTLIEMLQFLIFAAPDTFVALDCFPLPSSVVSHPVNDGSFTLKASEVEGKIKSSSEDVTCLFKSKGFDSRYQSLAFDHIISCIQKHAHDLAKATSSVYPGHCLAKAVQSLDKSLGVGDVCGTYKLLFDDRCDGTVHEGWAAKISPCLRLSLKWVGTINSSFMHSVFVLCEWATCDFRDFRTAPPCNIKLTGRKDLSQVHIAVRLLKMKLKDMYVSRRQKNRSINRIMKLAKSPNLRTPRKLMCNILKVKLNSKHSDSSSNSSLIFESPGPLHDIIVCWIDQHSVHKGEGLKRLNLFIVELIRAGIFNPFAYVRQLIVSGIMDMNVNLVNLERCKRHYRILKQLPGDFLHNALEESGIVEGMLLEEALQIYLNERRLILRGSFSEQCDAAAAIPSSFKQKHNPSSAKDAASTFRDVEELKAAITALLQLPSTLSDLGDAGLDESQGSVRSILSPYSKIDPVEGTLGCEECRRAKRQKISEERNSSVQGHSIVLSDEKDAWWIKKGMKSLESLKVDEPVKSTKQPTKSRHKSVHKTNSLAQLAAARIEGSQGASTSHVCDNKVSCPHHKTAMDGDMPMSVDGIQAIPYEDIVSIGRDLKRLRFVEKRAIAIWLVNEVRLLVQAIEKNTGQIGQFGRPFAVADDRSTIRWKLGEDELSTILYLMDISDDLVSAVKFLLWLLPKVPSSPSFTIHNGRNVPVMPRNVDGQVCDVGEAFLLSSLRRYENILAAADLVPKALSAAMHRTTAIMASNGRISGSAVLAFSCYLLKKYSNVASVIDWEKTFKATSDRRLSSELDFGRSMDGESGFPLGVPKGVEDLDDFFRQKITGGRSSRIGLGMRDIVQRNVEEALNYLVGKERKPVDGAPKGPAMEKWDNGYKIAQQIVTGLIDCIRQTGGAAQEGDPSLVSSAVSVIVGSVGRTIARIPDFSVGNSHSSTLATGSLNYARCILRMHITCLCLLKEALGERQSRVFEVALATEASTVLAGVFAPSKASRAQFQMSPEGHDAGISISNDSVNNSSKVVFGRATKIVAAVSALVVGAVIYGVSSLQRMVTVLLLKEGLDVAQFVRSTRSNSNGNARSVGGYKADSSIEVYVHWFRLFVGNCRTINDGLVVELLGEPSIIALSRMQHMLPLRLVFPPAYSMFALVLWWPFIMNSHSVAREDMNQLHQSLYVAINDVIKHLPFRDVCLRDSQSLYDFMAADASDAEFAKLLELNGSDMHFTSKAFVPLRARLFLNAMIDCKMPQSMLPQDDGSEISGYGESKLRDKIVHVLDNLQPAKFHWQWVELRLLLNEQALVEKLEATDMSLADAIRLSFPNPEKSASASENKNNFIAIILTRLLVRPDAASLFSELIHLFGTSLEDSMLLQAKWFLAGHGVLFGRKTIKQWLNNIAESKGLSVKAQYWEPWGWCNPCTELGANREKFDTASFEEGEVVEGGMELKRCLKSFPQVIDQLHVTERALVELIIPCIDQSSDETRNSFASDLIKQLNSIEQQISAITRGLSKQSGNTPPKIEGQTNKVNSRKATRGGSPGLARRQTAATDSSPPSPAALQASLSLRLHFIMRFLPILCTDGKPSLRNMRHALASVILRLLGSRVVYEDAVISVNALRGSQLKREVESPSKASAGPVEISVEGLFDRMLFVLHGLLSSCLPSWLRSPVFSKSTSDTTWDISGFDQELLETLQNDLDHMQLPGAVRWRIQAAMPALVPSMRCSLSCQPPSVPVSALFPLQHRTAKPVSNSTSSNTRNPVSLRTAATTSGKSKQQDNDLEVDPWTLLEDGAASSTATAGSGDHVNLQAASWLRGAIRVRRTDLTYIGAGDDET